MASVCCSLASSFYLSVNFFTLPCWFFLLCSSVQFSHSVVSDSLQPHESKHARPPCPSPTPGVYSNSCPSSQWCHPTISSSVVPFSCPQSLPASGSFPMSQLFAWGDQSIGVSASVSVFPMNTQDWSPLLLECPKAFFSLSVLSSQSSNLNSFCMLLSPKYVTPVLTSPLIFYPIDYLISLLEWLICISNMII